MVKSEILAPHMQAQAIHQELSGEEILHGIDLTVYGGQLTVINGESGSGKTTLLNVLSGLDRPTSGNVDFYRYPPSDNPADRLSLTGLRKRSFETWRSIETGIIFQDPGLLPGESAASNITLPNRLKRIKLDKQWVGQVCATLGIDRLLEQPAGKLSGGQAQRVAIARALAHQPGVLFADEPTASLDSDNTKSVHEIFRRFADQGTSIVMVSHDATSLEYADHVVNLRDGLVDHDTHPSYSPTHSSVA